MYFQDKTGLDCTHCPGCFDILQQSISPDAICIQDCPIPVPLENTINYYNVLATAD